MKNLNPIIDRTYVAKYFKNVIYKKFKHACIPVIKNELKKYIMELRKNNLTVVSASQGFSCEYDSIEDIVSEIKCIDKVKKIYSINVFYEYVYDHKDEYGDIYEGDTMMEFNVVFNLNGWFNFKVIDTFN